jgi:hypothetical protein
MAVAELGVRGPSLDRVGGRVSNLREPALSVELGLGELVRMQGDNRWRMIACMQGVVWITQERDMQDYVLTAGQIFLVTLPGTVLVQGVKESSVQVTPSLRTRPYVGNYLTFH